MQELRHIVIKSFPRIVAIGLLFVAFNLVYQRYFWKQDLHRHGPLLLELQQSEDQADVLYFGESSNFNVFDNDVDKSTISQFLDGYLPSLKVAPIDHSAYHGGQFLPLIENIKETSRAKIIVVTMNLRTFGPDAIFGINEGGLQKTARFNRAGPPLLNRLFIALNHYDNRSPHERDILKWDAWTYDTLSSDSVVFEYNTIRRWCEPVKFPDSLGQENMKLRVLADQNIKVFGFHIYENNPMVHAFDQIAAIAKQKNITVIYNILAENVDQVDSLVGSNLLWVMKNNRDFLVQRYRNMNVIVVDNLELVGDLHFKERDFFPTEHYDETGRKTIARNVANAIIALPN